MESSIAPREAFPPRIAALIPLVLLVHQVEEWFGGFPEWTQSVVGDGVEPEQFLVINAVGLVLFSVWTLAAFRAPRMAWIAAALAALLGLNGLVHAGATLLLGRYAPGTVTGLVLSVPFSVVVLRAAARALPRPQVVGAVVGGVALHGMVTLIALM